MTLAEIQAAIKETPALQTELFGALETDFTKHLTDGKGKIVTDVETVSADRQKLIDTTTNALHSSWEKTLEPYFGKKADGVKGLDWAAEKAKAIKEQTDNNNPDAKDTALKQVQQQLTKLETQIAEKDKALAKAKVDAAISSTFEGFDFTIPAHLKTPEQKAAFIADERASKRALFEQKHPTVEEGGKTYFTKDGVKQVDNSGNPLTVSQIIEKDYGHWVKPKSHSGGGAGTGDDNDPLKGKPEYKGANTEEIRATLQKEDLVTGSLAWKDAYNKAHAAIGVDPIKD